MLLESNIKIFIPIDDLCNYHALLDNHIGMIVEHGKVKYEYAELIGGRIDLFSVLFLEKSYRHPIVFGITIKNRRMRIKLYNQ